MPTPEFCAPAPPPVGLRTGVPGFPGGLIDRVGRHLGRWSIDHAAREVHDFPIHETIEEWF